MGLTNYSSSVSNNVKFLALESTLQQFMVNFKELLSEFEQLQIECDMNKQQFLKLKNNCDINNCSGVGELKKIIENKNRIIQSVASSLTKLNDTKDWNVLTETFKILFEETTPSKSSLDTPVQITSVKEELDISPQKEDVSITEDVSFKEESLCEIDGTPTGRTSPIIHTRKTKSVLAKSSDYRDKKKCPDHWPTPESKSVKLTYTTPARSKTGKLRQSRINIMKLKQTCVVDLTCSPELSKGSGSTGEGVMPLIKKESMENEDTILPSPTSGPQIFTLIKTTSKDSPSKFKRPALSLKLKTEKCVNESKHEESINHKKDVTAIEDSINILNPLVNRFNGVKKENQSLKKTLNANQVPTDEDATHCETNSSISLLDHINQLEQGGTSPAKRPLVENINIMNTPPKQAEPSMSVLPENKISAIENVKRKLPELVEPIYKEPTVRNKQEKRNLQGWSCEQCKNFYGELYKNDPVMLAKKINECSKHRGRHNPERPKTPPNFWNPRWHVPEDTEELNRMNNAN